MTPQIQDEAEREARAIVGATLNLDCTCTVEYTSRKLVDPHCSWHEDGRHLIPDVASALLARSARAWEEGAQLRGRWVTAEHGGDRFILDPNPYLPEAKK